MDVLQPLWKTGRWLLIIGVLSLHCVSSRAETQVLTLLDGESFWGGCVTDGRAMPFGKTTFERDLYGNTGGNQAQPLLISDRGRYVWCEEPFRFSFDGKQLKLESREGKFEMGRHGDSFAKPSNTSVAPTSPARGTPG